MDAIVSHAGRGVSAGLYGVIEAAMEEGKGAFATGGTSLWLLSLGLSVKCIV